MLNNTTDTKLSREFTPTWLYIKQHNVTGLKYFGKTVKKDPTQYLGSGTYWRNHLSKHGNDISTVWYKLFQTHTELTEYALTFSKENNIIDSMEWANLIYENGVGGQPGKPRDAATKEKLRNANLGKKQSTDTCAKHRAKKVSDTTKAKISKSSTGKKLTAETKLKMVNSFTGRQHSPHSAETKLKMSLAKKGKPPNNKGKKLSVETRAKMRESRAKQEAAKKALS